MHSQRRNLLRDVTWLLATLFAIGPTKGLRKMALIAPGATSPQAFPQTRARIAPPPQSVMRRG